MSDLALTTQTYVPLTNVDGEGYVINKLDNFKAIQNLIFGLEERFISATNLRDGKYSEGIEKEIIKYYFEYTESHKKIPTLNDIFEDVVEYNFELCGQIAEIDFANDYNGNYSEEIDDDTDIGECLNALTDGWCEIEREHFDSMDEAIEMVLNKFLLTYYHYPDSKAYLSFKHLKQLKIVHNDAQNMINPEWITSGLDYLGDYIRDLSKIRIVIENE